MGHITHLSRSFNIKDALCNVICLVLKRVFKVTINHHILLSSPMTLCLSKLLNLTSQWMVCVKFDWNDFFTIFHYFVIIPPWRRSWPFFLLDFNLLHLVLFCVKWIKTSAFQLWILILICFKIWAGFNILLLKFCNNFLQLIRYAFTVSACSNLFKKKLLMVSRCIKTWCNFVDGI